MTENVPLNEELERLKSVVSEKIQKFASDRTIRRYIARLEKLELSKVSAEQAIRVVAIFLSTPLGQWLLTVVLLELLAKAHFFSQISVDILIGLITGSELLQALAKSGVLTQIAGLAGLF
jgi:hypothetical protein